MSRAHDAVQKWLSEPEGFFFRVERLVEDREMGRDPTPWLEAAYELGAAEIDRLTRERDEARAVGYAEACADVAAAAPELVNAICGAAMLRGLTILERRLGDAQAEALR